MPRPLLLCFATEDEARPFRSVARHLEGVQLLLTGVGAANATRSLEAALSKVGRDSVEPRSAVETGLGSTESRHTARFAAVINAGFAGALDPALRAGALVCESSHTRLLWAARDAGCAPVPFAHSDRILITPAEKSALRAATEADAVDMESAALRAVCARRGIPFLNLRVISDAADEAMPLDFNRCCTPDLRLQIHRVLLELAKSPARLPRLLAFHRTVRRCAATLATALTGMVASLRGRQL
jgi:adenosylhomocysteine nucleosidase